MHTLPSHSVRARCSPWCASICRTLANRTPQATHTMARHGSRLPSRRRGPLVEVEAEMRALIRLLPHNECAMPFRGEEFRLPLRGWLRYARSAYHQQGWATMQLNAMFPTRDIGNDPAKIRDWAQAAEDLGFAYIEVPDHVFGATARDGWTPLYNEKDPFHETFVTLGFLAAVTKRIRLSSGVLIAPQRQTGLIAKQAAETDLLSGGRLRLGIGVGWNHVEYEALGEDWKTRGARQAEQVEVLRRLWSEDLVTFKGRFHA